MKSVLLLLIMAVFFVSCKDDDEIQFPPELDQIIAKLDSSFDSLNVDMAANAAAIAADASDPANIRNRMLDLFEGSSFVLEFAFITPQGIMEIVEPEVYHYIEGSDISQQDHIVKGYQTKTPVLSETFDAVEGFNASVCFHPCVNSGAVVGGITSLFQAHTIIGRTVNPLVAGQTFEVWVMEKGGKVLFDQDGDEIGLNVLTDDIYQDFPELIEAAKLIDRGMSGETQYSFFQTGTNTTVTKKTYWKTFELYGTQWKIIWVKPI